MSAAFDALLPYFLRSSEYNSSVLFIDNPTRCLLCMFASMYNNSIGLNLCGQKSSWYLCMRRSRPCLYLFGEYSVHHRHFNLCHPISVSSGLSISVLIITGWTTDGPVNMDFLGCSIYFP